MSELCFMTARELVARMTAGELSAREVMEAHLRQIERIDPLVNAIPTRVAPESALSVADEADARRARGEQLGALHGLPIAYKDVVSTKGIRTTLGSPIFADNVPEIDDIIVERIRGAGAITVGKTNVPEFAAGSHTFNPVFGATLNPWDRTKTAGGSSGGAAVALACGMLPIADGSDHGGSLRNPGNFNSVVGFRPSPGRVPNWPSQVPWFAHSVKGPMARNTADTALLLSVMAGPDARAPLSIETPGEIFRRPLECDFRGVRVAYSPDLGGLPVDPRVRAVLDSQVQAFRDLGCQVEEASPDLSDADEVFLTLRAWNFAANQGALLARHRERIKDSVVWNIEEGLRLNVADISRAELKRGALYQRVRAFMEQYEFLICPVNQVPPFDVDIEYPTEIDGVEMENYISWMKSAYYITVTGLPALSAPCGFTPEGLPVGVQIVGRWHADFSVLQLAHAFEQVSDAGARLPPLVV